MCLSLWKNVSKRNGVLVHAIRSCHSEPKKIHSTTDYCVELVRGNDHENFLCTLLLSGEVRQAAFAIRAFNIEIAKISDHAKEKNIAQMRMKFWFDSLDGIFKKDPPKHPVALELARAVSKHGLHRKNLKRLISARADLLNLKFNSIEEMEKYSEETVSPLYYLILQSAGSQSVEADHMGSHLGKAQGLVTLLRSTPHNIASRSLPLPNDLLVKHGVSQESVFRAIMCSGLREVVFEVASTAKVHLNKARSLEKKVSREHRAVFLPAVAVDSYLEKLRFYDFDIFNPSFQQRNASLGFKLLWYKFKSKF